MEQENCIERDGAMRKKVLEMMHFMEFSIKEDTKFLGAVTFCLKTEWNTTQSFTVRISEENGLKIATGTLGIESPSTVVNMTAVDFFLIYSGEASAFEVTKMIMRRRIWVVNHDYGKLNAFATSFDYSSERWISFYKYMEEIASCNNRIKHICSIPCMKLLFNDMGISFLNRPQINPINIISLPNTSMTLVTLQSQLYSLYPSIATIKQMGITQPPAISPFGRIRCGSVCILPPVEEDCPLLELLRRDLRHHDIISERTYIDLRQRLTGHTLKQRNVSNRRRTAFVDLWYPLNQIPSMKSYRYHPSFSIDDTILDDLILDDLIHDDSISEMVNKMKQHSNHQIVQEL